MNYKVKERNALDPVGCFTAASRETLDGLLRKLHARLAPLRGEDPRGDNR